MVTVPSVLVTDPASTGSTADCRARPVRVTEPVTPPRLSRFVRPFTVASTPSRTVLEIVPLTPVRPAAAVFRLVTVLDT